MIDRRQKTGFTLLEMMLAVSILVVVSMVTYLCFSTVATAYKKGIKLSDGIHHADFVLDQLVMGLRSAYYPDAAVGSEYGFSLEDNGDGERDADKISWVKLGHALVGADCPFAGTPHRIEFTIDENEDGEMAATVRAWRILGQLDDFDPDEDVAPEFIATGMTGFNCRPIDPDQIEDEDEDEIEWLDEWEDSNRVPTAVEITLYMEPLDEGEEAVEIKRLVRIPVAALSWQRSSPRPPTDANTDGDAAGGGAPRGTSPPAGSGPGAAPPAGSRSRKTTPGGPAVRLPSSRGSTAGGGRTPRIGPGVPMP